MNKAAIHSEPTYNWLRILVCVLCWLGALVAGVFQIWTWVENDGGWLHLARRLVVPVVGFVAGARVWVISGRVVRGELGKTWKHW
jgi:hypothetical protein